APARGGVRARGGVWAVTHPDLEIRAGGWPIRRAEPFPYVPGVEVVGDIAEVGAGVTGIAVGQRVMTMMQGLAGVRAERDGGYAELVTVAADAVAPGGPDIHPVALAGAGLAGVPARG